MKTKDWKRILIFNVNWLGDVLFSTAAIRNIRRNFPDSFIACVIPARCYQVLKGNPHLDEVIIFDERERHGSPLAKLDFIARLRAKRFDVVFLLHRSFTRALICRMAGIPERIGYNAKRRGLLLTQKIPQPSPDSMHRIDYYLNIAESAGLRIEDRYPEFFVEDKDTEFVQDFLKKNSVLPQDYLVVLNPGGNWLPKRWPKEHWTRLAERLIAELSAKVIITGSHNDLTHVSSIIGPMTKKPVNACDHLSLKQLAALAKRSDVFVTADTGPLHIANAVGARSIVALFGPTMPAITGPVPDTHAVILQKNVECSIPCYETQCQDNRCMRAITVDEVIDKIRYLKGAAAI